MSKGKLERICNLHLCQSVGMFQKRRCGARDCTWIHFWEAWGFSFNSHFPGCPSILQCCWQHYTCLYSIFQRHTHVLYVTPWLGLGWRRQRLLKWMRKQCYMTLKLIPKVSAPYAAGRFPGGTSGNSSKGFFPPPQLHRVCISMLITGKSRSD